VAKLVARLLATAAFWVRIQTSQKYKMGDISKGVATKLSPAKKIATTKYFVLASFADPGPRSSAFLAPGTGMEKSPDPGYETRDKYPG
jgi:hypothetical protein